MGAARTITFSAFKDQCNYELRNTDQVQYTTTEMFTYIDRCQEIIYEILVDSESELVYTGTGSFVTVAGTEAYDLAANSMGDAWTLRRVWITGSEPMGIVNEEDRYDYLAGSTSSRSQPEYYYLEGDNIGLLPIADAVYTINVKYFPNWTPYSTSATTLSFKNLFNPQIKAGVKLFAKNRENEYIGVEAELMELFQERALQLMRRRRKESYQMIPRT